VKVWPHSLNGALEATTIEARSSRSVRTCNQQFSAAAVDVQVAELVETSRSHGAVAGHRA